MTRPPLHERIFAALLRLFPSEFRGDFGEEMTADFRDSRDEAATTGRRSPARFWVRTLLDFGRRAPLEHLDILRRDAGYAMRAMRRRPAFTACLALTLAIGIGLNVAVFSVVSGVLLRRLPFPQSTRLVGLFEVEARTPDTRHEVSSANFIDWKAQARTLDGSALVGGTRATMIAADANPEQVTAMTVSEGFFDMLATRPALGRLFNARDYEGVQAQLVAESQKPGRLRSSLKPEVVILGHAFWQRYFAGRTDVIGSKVRLGNSTAEVIGVMPAGFALSEIPALGPADCWLPDVPDPGFIYRRSARHLTAIGRLAPGVSLDQAQAEFSVIADRLAMAYPQEDKNWTVRLVPLLDTMTAGVRTELWFLFGAAVCVLLIACANVANLLLASAHGRRLEMATRVAMGATRAHLVRQLLTESLALSTLGGLGGMLLTYWAVPVLIQLAPTEIPRLNEVAVDGQILAFGTVLSFAVGIGCGLAACLSPDRVTPAISLRSGRIDAAAGHHRFRYVLTTAQVALAMLLIIAAGLLVRTVRALGAVELGFDPRNVVTVQLNPDHKKYGDFAATVAFQLALIDQIRQLPGVIAIGTGPRPLRGSTSNIIKPDPDKAGERTDVVAASPGYFVALRARLVQGRFFQEEDAFDVGHVAVINEAGARRFFGGGTAIGRMLWMDRDQLAVVGVLADIRNRGLEADVEPAVYLPQAQSRMVLFNTLSIRTAGAPREIVPAVRTLLKRLDSDQPLTAVETLQEQIDKAMAPRRFILRLVGLFSGLALGLAMLGTYAVLAESVAQRVPEIGVRVALGATRGAIVRMILSQGAWMVVVGIGCGLVGAFALRHVMSTFVFGVPTTDFVTYGLACAGMALATLAACSIPARRAAGIDPVIALRQE